MVTRGDARLEVLTQGKGPPIVLLPSLGRGAADFDPIAERLADAGFRVLRPQPRGIGQSTGPWQGVTLEDLAADIAAVIEHDGGGPAFVVGHAFGNRVARMLATARPDLVRAVSLVAANVGHNPSPPDVRAAIRMSADVNAPDDERIKAMQFVFFAPGSDARVWLKGWHPEVLAAQRIAGDLTPRTIDYAAGQAPVLYIQPSHDPARPCRGRRGIPARAGRPRHRRGHSEFGPCRDCRAARCGERRADRVRPQTLACSQ